MIFNSIDFLIFFPIVILIYMIIPQKLKCLWLLLSSYYFYMCWNARYAILIAVSTIVTYLAGILIEKYSNKSTRKRIVAGGFIINLGILFFFKYFDFTLDNLNAILSIFHIQCVEHPFDILLPVGISFYTFQALGYLVDVYRGDCKAEKNLLHYALFVSFFPQLVAGPIERSKNLLGQIEKIEEKRLWNYHDIVRGFTLMCWGLFMKMVIADRIALFVTEIFAHIFAIGTIDAILGAFAFAIQIYCDFGGYSCIAIGAAKVMGIDLMENFNTPYFAVSIGDFWHRWHISLSTWFRDYLYIPLGGNRCSRFRKYVNILITFLVSGIWHGASWNFVIWGGIHGIYQIIGDLIRPIRKRIVTILHINTEVFSYHFGRIVGTFLLTSFAWIFFRAKTISDAFLYVKNLFTRWNPWVIFDESLFGYGLDRREVGILIFAILVLVVVDLLRYIKGKDIGSYLLEQNLVFRWIVIILIIVFVLVYGEYGIQFDSTEFIYFAF